MTPWSIGACLITKDSEATLEAALARVRPFVDHVYVYDTGSTDGTLDLLARLAAQESIVVENETGRVLAPDELATQEPGEPCPTTIVPLAPITVERGEWRDDFAWARERSFDLARASGDHGWLLWLDDDDEIVGGEHLRTLAARAHPTVDGFVFLYEYAHDERGQCVCQLWRERLTRADRGFYWANPVHEVLVIDGRVPTLELVPAEVARYIHRRPAGRYAPTRNLEILRAAEARATDAGEQPDPRTLAYLGTETLSHNDPQAAIGYFERYLTHPDAQAPNDERMQTFHKLAIALRLLGAVDDAIAVELQALKERDDWGETFAGLMEAYVQKGNWGAAERWAKRLLQVGIPSSMMILNPLEFGFLPLVRLSEACANQGRLAEAIEWIDRAAARAPGNPLVAEHRANLERAKMEADVVSAVLLLRETLVRHDENAKALQLVESVPYGIQDHPAIVKARADQRAMCRHLTDPEEYERWYRDEPKESTVGDELVPEAAANFHRVGFLERGLEAQEKLLGRKPRLLDVGCNDFWMGAYFRTKGYEVDGIELNRRAFEIALERAARFGAADSTIVHGNLHDAPRLLTEAKRERVVCPRCGETHLRRDVAYKAPCGVEVSVYRELPPPLYDAVSMFEVLEHVPDVAATLDVLERLVVPGGRIYLSTPDGAYEKGHLNYWHVVEPKGHLRALPANEFVRLLDERGKIHEADLGQGLVVGSYEPLEKPGRIVFFAGGCLEQWSPQQANTKGLGGSETMLVRVSEQLARAGFSVTVYADTPAALTPGGVIWRPATAWDPSERCDLLVASRRPDIVDVSPNARAIALWCHDHSYGNLTEERAARFDRIVVLSDWQRDRFARLYPYAAEKLAVIRNSIVLEDDNGPRFPDAARPFEERKPRVIYSSSADRGLDVLLDMWPRVRERVPDAELHVFYGWDVFDKAAALTPGLLAFKQHVLAQVEALGGEDGGVFMRGRVGQDELRREMQEARVWGYPTAFLETSCISAMEAQAAGLAVVTSKLAALAETVGDRGRTIGWPADETEPYNRDAEYQDAFVDLVVAGLTSPGFWGALSALGRDGAAEFDWTARTEQWAALAPAPARKPRAKRRKVTA